MITKTTPTPRSSAYLALSLRDIRAEIARIRWLLAATLIGVAALVVRAYF